MSVRSYTVGANWSRGPAYAGPLEDVSSYISKETDVVASFGRTDPYAYADAVTAKLTYKLLNHTRNFSPDNALSPVGGRQTVGTPTRLLYGTTSLFAGAMSSTDISDARGDKSFTVEAADAWIALGEVTLSTDVKTGYRTGDLISFILDTVGWPASLRSIDPGATTVPYWWVEGVSAKTAVTDLVHSEGQPAIAFVGKGGVFTFRDRHHRLTRSASLTSQGTHTHIVPAGPIGTDHKVLEGSFAYSQGLDRIVNSATLEVTIRQPGPVATVWQSTDAIALGASEVRSLFIQADTPAINAIIPLQGTDFTVSSGSVSAVTISRTSGQSFIITIYAGAGGAVLPGMSMRANPLIEAPTQKFTSQELGSQAIYGINEWAEPSAPWASYYDAQAIVDLYVSTYAYPQASVTFDIEGRLSSGTLSRIIAADISDRITVRNDETGLNNDFHIDTLQHGIKQLGVRHTLTVGAQVATLYQASNPITFDVAGKGFNDGQFGAWTGTNPNTMFQFDVAGRGFDQGRFAT